MKQFDFIMRLFRGEEGVADKRAPQVRAAQPQSAEPSRAPSEAELRHVASVLLIAANAPALAGRLQIRWNARMRSTAGMAYPGKSLITLNPRLAEFPGEVERTLRHELAHLLAHERAGRRRIAPHGAEWKKACRDLGLADERRTHSLPLPRTVRRRRHLYRCTACGNEVARVVPFRTACACLHCCRAHNHGRYDARFRFVKVTK